MNQFTMRQFSWNVVILNWNSQFQKYANGLSTISELISAVGRGPNHRRLLQARLRLRLLLVASPATAVTAWKYSWYYSFNSAEGFPISLYLYCRHAEMIQSLRVNIITAVLLLGPSEPRRTWRKRWGDRDRTLSMYDNISFDRRNKTTTHHHL